MLDYTDMSTKPKIKKCQPGVWSLILAMLLFALTLTGVALLEVSRIQYQKEQSFGQVSIVNRLWLYFQTQTNKTDAEVPATVERIARDASNTSQNATGRSNNYYEEQRAVVVNSESLQPNQDTYDMSDSYDTDPYYDAAAEDYVGQQSAESDTFSDGESSTSSEGEGRSAQGRPSDSYYGQWQYAKQTPAPASNNRKLQPVAGNRPPYDAYDDVYDYPMGFQPRPLAKQVTSKQVASALAPVNAGVPAPVSQESTLVTFLKVLKQMWDLYQAITSAWGTVSERHQVNSEELKKERLEKQRLRLQQQQQQQIKSRINSKKPPRLESDKFAQRNQTKKSKGTSTTTTTTTVRSTSSTSDLDSSTEQPTAAEHSKLKKGDTDEKSSARSLRFKREAEPETASTDVGEGRYIKGDPLKGYYDFVITEGSYKFWAAFQVGTAILVIYSTFAAIYYSKVNPLTSDYDYQDYLGAGRSLSGGDDDFVDDSEPVTPSTSSPSLFTNWLPRTAQSLQFILDAIDKIPLDQDRKGETGWSTEANDTTIS